MSRLTPTLVRVADIAPMPWRNGAGVTRELLAWPDPQDWLLRVSVADIEAPGPFSAYPGVDRWFAVLEGGAVRLDAPGTESKELTALHADLHPFSGDVATHCSMLGAATRDFNLMAQRSRLRLTQQSLRQCPVLKTRAAVAGLFVAQGAELRQEGASVRALPPFTLAWWSNADGELLSLNVESINARGWWFEANAITNPVP
jgi:environmental stress-induced protein Ves